MDSQRSSKRRKLDTAQNGVAKSSPATNSMARLNATPKKPAPSANIAASPSHAAWREAKATSTSLAGKKYIQTSPTETGTDVYDDIEGAHARQSPLKRTLPTSASATPVKKQKSLDPLRNQTAVMPSPAKRTASLGFFKQFRTPKKEGEAVLGGREGDGRSGRIVNGKSHADKGDKEVDESNNAEDESGEGAGDASSTSEEMKVGGKRWTYDMPRKTFEDEIRELENVARQEADKNDGDGAGTSASQKRRSRTATPKASYAKVAERRKSIAKSPQVKRPIASSTFKLHQPDLDSEDRMQIDDSQEKKAEETAEAGSTIRVAAVPTPTKAKLLSAKQPPSSAKDTYINGQKLQLIQTIIQEKLTSKRPTRLTNLEDEYTKVSTLITQTITAGESNSMLVIGGRGSGKSSLINQILSEQSAKYTDDFHVVRLNGFIHTDDKIALREIWRQLGREMEVADEDQQPTKNYADTLTTLLALLSHPAEHGRAEEGGQVTKSVIFILDEFELFASHPRQTLLYNLFDIAQSRKAPIAVLGLTTKIDCVEGLEKRVKSRFSHRYVHLSSPKSFAAFVEACKVAVAVDLLDLNLEERERLGVSGQAASKGKGDAMAEWNALINEFLASEAAMNHLKRLYYTTKSISDFHNLMLLPIATLPIQPSTSISTTALLTHLTTNTSTLLQPPDSKLPLLHTLSTLQLALLISAARLTNIHAADILTFAQAYDEYKSLASKAKLQASASGSVASGRVWAKGVSLGAWEGLVGYGLLVVEGRGGGVRVDVGLEEIGVAGEGVEGMGLWGRWCREI